MNMIVTADDRDGIAFHGRRLSRDRSLCSRILEKTQGHTLRMSPYSYALFRDLPHAEGQIAAEENFLEKAGREDYCFLELKSPAAWIDQIDEIWIYRWNRLYPEDTWLDFPLQSYHLTGKSEFQGSSHEKITEERYCKNRFYE